MLDKAKADIRTEQENAMKAMESRVAEIALDAASKIMGEKNSFSITFFMGPSFLQRCSRIDR